MRSFLLPKRTKIDIKSCKRLIGRVELEFGKMRSSRLFRNNKRICWLRGRCSKRVKNWCNRFSRSVQDAAAYCRRYPDGASGWNNRPSGGMKRPLALCAECFIKRVGTRKRNWPEETRKLKKTRFCQRCINARILRYGASKIYSGTSARMVV